MSFFVTNRFLSKLRQYSLRIQQSLSEQTRTADPLDVDSRIKMQHIDLIGKFRHLDIVKLMEF